MIGKIMADGPPVPRPARTKPAKPVLEVRAVVPLVAPNDNNKVWVQLLSVAMASKLSDGRVPGFVTSEAPRLRAVPAMEMPSEYD